MFLIYMASCCGDGKSFHRRAAAAGWGIILRKQPLWVRSEAGERMAGSVNKVILVGNLGKDPEVRSTQSGSKIVNFTLATSDTWNDKATGERKERTEWHRVVIFNVRLADIAERY